MANNIIRPLGRIETNSALMHEENVNTVAFTTWITSKRVITDDVWEQCLSQLQRDIPHLRLVIVWQEGKRHFKYMDIPRVDIELIEGTAEDDWEKVHEDMMRVSFDTANGPLWRVRVVRMPKRNADSRTEGYAVNENDLFNSVVVFGVHHSIMDGTSSLYMLRRLINILNAATSGVPCEDSEDVMLQPALEDLLPRVDMAFNWRDYIQVAILKLMEWFPRKSLYMKRFPPPTAVGDTYTKTVAVEFSIPETERILAKCKDHGTTVHGIFFAAASMAMASLVNDGKPHSVLNIGSTHAVNMRRFLPPELKTAFGLLVWIPAVTLMTPTTVAYSALWRLAKNATQVVHSALRNGEVTQSYKIEKYMGDDSVKRMLAYPDCTMEFFMSNIGDCDKLCPPGGKDDEVHATRIVTSTASLRYPAPFVHFLHKFRGRFCYNVDYCTNRVSDTNAHKYAELTVELMKMAAGDE
ncbi:uncharacterized protein LOC106178629 [Lingula anatina]|uniref:Uncharacterized protein LOC106178629 n=1 Tax=Lingula anatina TaxID=7574 RepID=A0A1S3K507_LINAN|nr:uncharacterized protein LOC106178629 [Lingula anatina]|eukprot:XP_013417346.1 uncharacterized protein LOC106178629 [Lingula anatina]